MKDFEYNLGESTKKEKPKIYQEIKLNKNYHGQLLCRQSDCGFSLGGQSLYVLITTKKAAGVGEILVEISTVRVLNRAKDCLRKNITDMLYSSHHRRPGKILQCKMLMN